MNHLAEIPAQRPDIPQDIQSRWQRIADLMAGILSVPAGLIMRVDPPQIEVFLSSATEKNPFPKGSRADLGTGLYCETVMETRAPLLVPDASKDPEWDRNPDARIGMVFYLGYPLAWPDGEIFGTICVLDEKENPRAVQYRELLGEFRQVIEKDLGLIAGAYATASDLQRSREAILRSERELAEAQRITHLGSWAWDIRNDAHHWSDEFYRIFGLRPQASGATFEAFLASVHPDDRQAVRQANLEAVSVPGKPYDIEYRVVRPDGEERIVHARGEVLFDPDRKPLRMVGTLLDITERRRTEKELENAFVEIKTLKEKLEAENIYLREEVNLEAGFGEIVGFSDPIRRVVNKILQAAPTRTTVLLTGETGTGKGLFARFLHDNSGRSDKPFVNVNCAGLPPNLIESELFGREKGAFTGSTAKQIGRFELADGGTIFLDEIGELPLELQSKLLKVIEQGEFERLGSPRSVKVDVRIVAATSRNLEEEIRFGRFRQDLFYRLNVFPVTIPPLRMRKDDIPLLVRYFVGNLCRSHGKSITKIPGNVMAAFQRFDWPGNVRELINVVERAVIASTGPELRLAEPIAAAQEAGPEEAEERAPKPLAGVERDHILKTLEATGWRIEGPEGAAHHLGLNPSTLRARIRKLGIKRPGAR
jgi:PAS domain S-box-containing protein